MAMMTNRTMAMMANLPNISGKCLISDEKHQSISRMYVMFISTKFCEIHRTIILPKKKQFV